MGLHSLDANVEFLSDLLVAEPLSDQREDLPLALGQPIIALAPLAGFYSFEIIFHDFPRDRRVEEGFTPRGSAHGFHEVPRGCPLQHVAGRPGVQEFKDVALVLVHRQRQDVDVGVARFCLLGCLNPAHSRHADVHDYDGGLQALDHL